MTLIKNVLKSFLGIVIIFLLIGGISYGIYRLVTGDSVPNTDTNGSITVDAIEAKITDTALPIDSLAPLQAVTLTKTGLIKAGQEVAIYPEISAKVLASNVKEGQTVVKGQVLATLGDSTQLKNASLSYEAASALLANAESTLSLVQQSNQVNFSTYSNQINGVVLSLEQAHTQLESAKYIRYEQQIIKDATELQAKQTSETATETDLSNYRQSATEQDLYTEYLKQQISNDKNFVSDRQRDLSNYQGQVQDHQNILQFETVANQLNLLLKQLDLSTIKSQMDVINTKNQIIQLRQQLDTAKISLASGVITSPINGVVTKSSFDVGETVSPQSPLFTITNLNSVVIEASISPEEYFKITDAKTIETVVKVLDKTVPATITYIGLSADSVTKTIPIKIEPKITDAQIKRRFIPNTFAKVEFITSNETEPVEADASTYFKVPVIALKFEDDGIKIAVIEDDKVEYKTVKLAPPITAGMVGIASGLKDGDLVIVETTDLPEGAKVSANIIE